MLLIFLYYHGEVTIEPWEYMLGFFYGIVLFIFFSRKKNMNIKLHPEFKYYMPGFLMKIFAGFFFCMIYFYYYQGGDTTGFFYSGVAMKQMLFSDPGEFFRQVVLGDNSPRALATYSSFAIRPYAFLFNDDRTFIMLRLSSILALITFNSFFISTLIISSLSFIGVWACYRTFVGYFPQIQGKLAIAFLFMPSVVFWGSGIMKDTLSFSAVCGWVYAIDEIFFKRRNMVSRILLALFCAMVMIEVKAYIFMVLMPATLLWTFYRRIVSIRNALFRVILLPFLIIGLVVLSVFALVQMGDSLGKFGLDSALQNIEAVQGDLANESSYGENKFDLGTFDGTWWGVASKFPVATNATLFRPYLWEASNPVILLSGLENLFVLGLTLFVLLRAGPIFSLRCIASNPLLLMSMVFAILFAFVAGVTTPNFGALVRFKIPMLPFYIGSLFIIQYLHGERAMARRKGLKFDLAKYRSGAAPAETGKHGRGPGKAARRSNGLPGTVARA
jgi:hypothetical protein